MKRLGILAAAAVTLFLGASVAEADHAGKVPWVKDVQQGMLMARKTGKPIMLFFTADW